MFFFLIIFLFYSSQHYFRLVSDFIHHKRLIYQLGVENLIFTTRATMDKINDIIQHRGPNHIMRLLLFL